MRNIDPPQYILLSLANYELYSKKNSLKSISYFSMDSITFKMRIPTGVLFAFLCVLNYVIITVKVQ